MFPKQHLDALQLLLIAWWDGDFDIDRGAMLIARFATERFGEQSADAVWGEEFESETDPLATPLSMAVFEDLQDGRANVVFGVEEGERGVWVEGGFPDEGAVWLQFHAEERVGLGGEVVIVDTGVDECCGEVDLDGGMQSAIGIELNDSTPHT